MHFSQKSTMESKSDHWIVEVRALKIAKYMHIQ